MEKGKGKRGKGKGHLHFRKGDLKMLVNSTKNRRRAKSKLGRELSAEEKQER